MYHFKLICRSDEQMNEMDSEVCDVLRIFDMIIWKYNICRNIKTILRRNTHVEEAVVCARRGLFFFAYLWVVYDGYLVLWSSWHTFTKNVTKKIKNSNNLKVLTVPLSFNMNTKNGQELVRLWNPQFG